MEIISIIKDSIQILVLALTAVTLVKSLKHKDK